MSRATHYRHAELVSASIGQQAALSPAAAWTLKQVQGDDVYGATVAQKLLGISLEESVG